MAKKKKKRKARATKRRLESLMHTATAHLDHHLVGGSESVSKNGIARYMAYVGNDYGGQERVIFEGKTLGRAIEIMEGFLSGMRTAYDDETM